jgi:heat shock protein HtpX
MTDDCLYVMRIYNEIGNNVANTWGIMLTFFLMVIVLGFIASRYFGSPVILYGAVLFSIVMNITSYWFSDKIVLASTRARPIDQNDPAQKEVYRIVENLAITAGLPMPRVYIVDDPSPNAFATGRDKEHAVVAVTTGILSLLDRSELEGVLAHELGHVGNRDILVSTVAVVLVGFVTLLADMFLRMGHFGMGGRDRDGKANGLFLVLALVAAILAPIAANLMKLAVSRKRELLADASGALLTRYPEALATALIKISGSAQPMKHVGHATAHLFISDPLKVQGFQKTSWFASLFLTHPPVEERVAALRGMNIDDVVRSMNNG